MFTKTTIRGYKNDKLVYFSTRNSSLYTLNIRQKDTAYTVTPTPTLIQERLLLQKISIETYSRDMRSIRGTSECYYVVNACSINLYRRYNI